MAAGRGHPPVTITSLKDLWQANAESVLPNRLGVLQFHFQPTANETTYNFFQLMILWPVNNLF